MLSIKTTQFWNVHAYCVLKLESALIKKMGDGQMITVAKTNITLQKLNKSAHKNVINRYFVLMHYNFFFKF